MLIKNILIAVFLWGTAISFTSCTDQKPEKATEKVEIKTQPKKTNGVLYKPSPLANEMRRMYENMKLVNAQLKEGVSIDNSLVSGYDKILTAEATNPADLTPEFYGFANAWIHEVSILKEDPNLENYNSVMNACVHCHESFCPGPIPKIKKLKLVP